MKPKFHHSRFRGLLPLGAASLLGLAGLPALAQSISVNFGANQSTSTIADATKTSGAVPVAGNRWNNTTTNGSGTLGSLIDSAGTVTGASVAWTTNNTWQSASPGATATSENGFLTKGYLDDGGTGWTVKLVSPYLLNDIYIIHATDQAVSATTPAISAVSVNGVFYKGNGSGATVAATGSNDSWIATPFSTADTLVESSNFIKVPGQTDVNLAGLNSSPGRSAIAGVQVVNAYSGAVRYWDANGATAGSGGESDDELNGTWGSSAFWSESATGETATSAWVPGAVAVFSAGTDGISFNTVTVSGTQTAGAVWVQEGAVTLEGGTLDLSGGLGLLRNDNTSTVGLTIKSALVATNLSTLGEVALDGPTTVSGLMTVGGPTYLGTSQTFRKIAGTGSLSIGTNSLTLGDATNSTYAGALVSNSSGVSTLTKVGTGTLTLGSTSPDFYGSAIVSEGTLNLDAAGTLYWNISGPGKFTKSGTGTVVLRSAISTAGSLDISGGTLQIGESSDDASIGNPTAVNLGAGAVLSFRHTGTAGLTSPITLANAASQVGMKGTSSADKLELSGVIGSSTANGILRSELGTVNLNSGANVTVSTVSGLGTTVVPTDGSPITVRPGEVKVNAGATLTTLYVNMGDGSNQAGVLTVNGGTVVVPAGGNFTRIGHWNNGDAVNGSKLNVLAGTYDGSATNVITSIGWDGLGTLTVGGGSVPAVLKAWRLSMDANTDSTSYNCIGTLGTNGTIEAGGGGILGASVNDYLILNGGTAVGTASASWTVRLDVAADSTLTTASGAIVTHTGQLTGAAALTKTGAGTLRLGNTSTATPNTYTGAVTATEGTIELTGGVYPSNAFSANGTSTIYLGGTTTLAATANAGGTIVPGTATAPATATTGTLTLNGGIARIRVGTGGGLITAPAFSVTTPSTIQYLPSSPITAPVTLPLVNYEGSIGGLGVAGLSLVSLNPHIAGTLQDDTTNSQLVLNLTTADSVIWKGNLSGTWDVNSTSNWVLSSNPATSSRFYDYDVVKLDDTGIATPTLTLAGSILPTAIEVANTTGTYTLQGAAIGGTSSLLKSGAGGLTLLNDFSSSGALTLAAGVTTIGGGGTTGSVTGTVAGSIADVATLEFNRSDAATFSRPMPGAGTLRKKGTGTLTLNSGVATILPTNVVIESGTAQITVGSFGGDRMTGSGVLTVNAGATLINAAAHGIGGINTGMGDNLIINGTLTLNAEQYISRMTLNGATVNGTNEMRVPSGTVEYTIAGTAPSTFAARVNQGYSNGTWTVNDVTSSPAADLTVSGVMGGTFGPIKAGAGTMVLTGVNTYTGPTTINAGVLQIGAGGTAGVIGTGAITNNATLSFRRSDSITVAPVISGTGAVSQDGTGVLTLSGLNTYIGNTLVNAGTFNLADNAQLTFKLGANGVNNRIAGAGAVELLGDFNIDLTGADTTSGNSWTLVAPGGTRTYLSNFTVVGFTEATPGVHTMVSGANTWTFTEATGVLTVTGASGDYATWLAGYTFPAGADTSRTGDPDGDGVNNFTEYAFGLNPTSGASVSPITAPLAQTTGVFKYTRRASTGLTYRILTSTTLGSWTADAGAVQVPGAVDANGNQEVTVTLSGAPLPSGKFFVRVTAE